MGPHYSKEPCRSHPQFSLFLRHVVLGTLHTLYYIISTDFLHGKYYHFDFEEVETQGPKV